MHTIADHYEGLDGERDVTADAQCHGVQASSQVAPQHSYPDICIRLRQSGLLSAW
jgi:hypothetical protein